MAKVFYVFLVFLGIISVSEAQVDSLRSATHIFWSEDYTIQKTDFKDTIGNKRAQLQCDSLNLCWGAWVGLFSVLDEPKKKNKRGDLLEKVYFAPAFELAPSTRLNDDSLDYLTQLLVFDAYELIARRCRQDLEFMFEAMPYYGTKNIYFKTIEQKNTKKLKELVSSITRQVYIDKVENAYLDWRKTIDDLLMATVKYKTTNEDRFRFISDKPLNKDYQMAKLVTGALQD